MAFVARRVIGILPAGSCCSDYMFKHQVFKYAVLCLDLCWHE